MRPDELVQQQAGGADGNQDKAAQFKEITHLRADYSIFLGYLFLPTALGLGNPNLCIPFPLYEREGEEKDEGAGAHSNSRIRNNSPPGSPFEKGGLRGILLRNLSRSHFGKEGEFKIEAP